MQVGEEAIVIAVDMVLVLGLVLVALVGSRPLVLSFGSQATRLYALLSE